MPWDKASFQLQNTLFPQGHGYGDLKCYFRNPTRVHNTYTHTQTHMYVRTFECMYVCVCVCVCIRVSIYAYMRVFIFILNACFKSNDVSSKLTAPLLSVFHSFFLHLAAFIVTIESSLYDINLLK